MKRYWSLGAIVILGVTAACLLGGCGGSESGAPAGEAQLAPAHADSAGKMRVLIGFATTPGRAEASIVQAAGGTVMRSFTIVPVINAVIPASAKQALERNPNVTYVEGDPEAQAYEYYGSYPDETVDWGINRIDADAVWPSGNVGSGVNVAILDTGINGPAVGPSGADPTGPHPDLVDNVAGGTNIVNGVADQAHDDNGHGTHVAGIVGSIDNEFGNIGTAPAVSLYSVKVLGADGSGYYSWVIEGLQWCVSNNMQVANMSLGGRVPARSLLQACKQAYQQGVLLVAAAGNSASRVEYPAKYGWVIAVSGTDINDNLYTYSNTGKEIELSAPGVAVWSTCDLPLDEDEDGYATLTGTSMAAPHVAGTAALVIASGVTGPDAVRARLQETAEDLGRAGRDTSFGYGLVDAEAAVGPVNEPPTVIISSPADGATFDSGASISFAGTATDAEDGDITADLLWTSSIEGQLGTAGSFSTTLSDGTHIITAEVADSGGKSDSDSVTITVGTPAEVTVTGIDPNTMSAGSTIPVTITGSGFVAGADVIFENGAGPAPTASDVLVVGAGIITATVTAKSGGPPRDRVWDVRVTNPDASSGVLVGGLTVTP